MNLRLPIPYCFSVAIMAVSLVVGCGSETEPETVAQTIGFRGHRPGAFSFPRGIDIDKAGSIAVADKTGRVQLIAPSGESIHEWELPRFDNGTPTGLVFDQTDSAAPTILLADTHYSRILRYSTGGELLLEFGEYGDEPGQMIYPTDIALDPEGNMFITEYGEEDRVLNYSADGGFIQQWGAHGNEPGELNRALAILYVDAKTDAAARLVVADTCNHRIQIFSTTGELLSIWGEVGSAPGRLNYPYDIATDEEGNLFVAEYGNNRIQKFTIGGEPLGVYGGAGPEPGQFGAPWGIAYAAGALWVADTYNHRLQAVDPSDFVGGDRPS